MHTTNKIKSKSSDYHVSESATLTPKSLIEFVIDWSSYFNRKQTNTTARCEMKSATQDDRQHNAALRRWNHEKTQKKKFDISGNPLFILKEKKKRCICVILGKKKIKKISPHQRVKDKENLERMQVSLTKILRSVKHFDQIMFNLVVYKDE